MPLHATALKTELVQMQARPVTTNLRLARLTSLKLEVDPFTNNKPSRAHNKPSFEFRVARVGESFATLILVEHYLTNK